MSTRASSFAAVAAFICPSKYLLLLLLLSSALCRSSSLWNPGWPPLRPTCPSSWALRLLQSWWAWPEDSMRCPGCQHAMFWWVADRPGCILIAMLWAEQVKHGQAGPHPDGNVLSGAFLLAQLPPWKNNCVGVHCGNLPCLPGCTTCVHHQSAPPECATRVHLRLWHTARRVYYTQIKAGKAFVLLGPDLGAAQSCTRGDCVCSFWCWTLAVRACLTWRARVLVWCTRACRSLEPRKRIWQASLLRLHNLIKWVAH